MSDIHFDGKKAIIYTVAEKTIKSSNKADTEGDARIQRELDNNIKLLKHFAENVVGIHPNDCVLITDYRSSNLWRDSQKNGFSSLMDGVLLGGIRDVIIKHSGELTNFQDDMLAMVFEKMSVRLHILEFQKETPLDYYEKTQFVSNWGVLAKKGERQPRPFQVSKQLITSTFRQTSVNPLKDIGHYRQKFDQQFKNIKANVFHEEDIAYIVSEILANGSVSMMRMQEVQQFFANGSLRLTPDYGISNALQTLSNYTDNAAIQAQPLQKISTVGGMVEQIKDLMEFANEQKRAEKPDYAGLYSLYKTCRLANELEHPANLRKISIFLSSFYYDYRSLTGILASTKAYYDMLVAVYRFITDIEKVKGLPTASQFGEHYLEHIVTSVQGDLIKLIEDAKKYLDDATILQRVTGSYLSHFHEALLLLDNSRRKWSISALLSLIAVIERKPDGFLLQMSKNMDEITKQMSELTPTTSELKREHTDKRLSMALTQTIAYLETKTGKPKTGAKA